MLYVTYFIQHVNQKMTKKLLTSPNKRINVTEIRIAPQATTRLSRKIGSA